MKDDGFAGAAMDAFQYSGSLIGGLNVSVGTLQMLVWKGLFTKEEALFVLDVANESAAKMDLPSPYAEGLSAAYASARASIEAHC